MEISVYLKISYNRTSIKILADCYSKCITLDKYCVEEKNIFPFKTRSFMVRPKILQFM